MKSIHFIRKKRMSYFLNKCSNVLYPKNERRKGMRKRGRKGGRFKTKQFIFKSLRSVLAYVQLFNIFFSKYEPRILLLKTYFDRCLPVLFPRDVSQVGSDTTILRAGLLGNQHVILMPPKLQHDYHF